MQVLVAVEAQRLELRPGRATGFLGMRGILNRSYAFTARFKEEAIFPEAYPVIARETMTPRHSHLVGVALERHRLQRPGQGQDLHRQGSAG